MQTKYFLIFLTLFFTGACVQSGPKDWMVQDTGMVLDGLPVYRVSEKNACYDLQIDYPVFDDHIINLQVRDWVDSQYAAATGELGGICKNNRPAQPIKVWTESDVYTTSRTISIVFKSWIYADGSQQYYDSVETLNFLRSNGAALAYSDIFTNRQGFLEALSAYAGRKLAPALKDAWKQEPEYADSIIPCESLLGNFIITDSGIRLFFATRQIAPFYSGPQECDVPLKALHAFDPAPGIWNR